MTVELGDGTATALTERMVAALGPAARDAVNAAALEITTVARKRYQRAIGAEQRLSGVKAKSNGQGRRVNPYYRAATSESNPTALCGIRGPAQYVEHPRKGGYPVRPRRARAGGAPIDPARFVALAQRTGVTVDELQAAQGRRRNPAIRTPQGPRAGAKPGPITSPLRPFLSTVAEAPRLVELVALQATTSRIVEAMRGAR